MTPAGLIVWYYNTKADLGAPGLNFIDSTGRVYAKACEGCDCVFRNCNKANVWVCGKCGKPWPYEDHFILKGEVQTPNPPDVFERQNARWVDIGVIIHRLLENDFTKWDMRLYIATCHGFRIDPQEDKPSLAKMFQALWPKAPGPWSRRKIYPRVKRAKQLFEQELGKAEINYT